MTLSLELSEQEASLLASEAKHLGVEPEEYVRTLDLAVAQPRMAFGGQEL